MRVRAARLLRQQRRQQRAWRACQRAQRRCGCACGLLRVTTWCWGARPVAWAAGCAAAGRVSICNPPRLPLAHGAPAAALRRAAGASAAQQAQATDRRAAALLSALLSRPFRQQATPGCCRAGASPQLTREVSPATGESTNAAPQAAEAAVSTLTGARVQMACELLESLHVAAVELWARRLRRRCSQLAAAVVGVPPARLLQLDPVRCFRRYRCRPPGAIALCARLVRELAVTRPRQRVIAFMAADISGAHRARSRQSWTDSAVGLRGSFRSVIAGCSVRGGGRSQTGRRRRHAHYCARLQCSAEQTHDGAVADAMRHAQAAVGKVRGCLW